MKKFQHEVDVLNLSIPMANDDELILTRGLQGWELVSVVHRTDHGYTKEYLYWKREICEAKQVI